MCYSVKRSLSLTSFATSFIVGCEASKPHILLSSFQRESLTGNLGCIRSSNESIPTKGAIPLIT